MSIEIVEIIGEVLGAGTIIIVASLHYANKIHRRIVGEDAVEEKIVPNNIREETDRLKMENEIQSSPTIKALTEKLIVFTKAKNEYSARGSAWADDAVKKINEIEIIEKQLIEESDKITGKLKEDNDKSNDFAIQILLAEQKIMSERMEYAEYSDERNAARVRYSEITNILLKMNKEN